MNLNVYNRQKALPINKSSVKKILEALCLFLSIKTEEISVYFVSEKKICQLHEQFFNDPSPTDCITFPIDSHYLGDIFINPSAAIQYDPKDPKTETILYVVHGMLHLLGFDDIDPKKKRRMRKMEKKCMDHLREINLIPA